MAKSQQSRVNTRAEDALEIARLAGLSKLDYDREREAAAEGLGCRVAVLDELVQEARGSNGVGHKGQGRPLVFNDPEPWPEQVDGGGLLDDVVTAIERFIILPDHAANTIALWIVHTYCFTAQMITPRLLLKSAQKRSGKTSLLTLIGAISARALPTANISAAAVYRTVELAQPTLLVDEGDTFIAENDELRGCLNAGFMRGGQCIRVVGEQNDPRLFSCWSPVAIAAIRRLPDTIEDRAVAIPMKRRRRDEDVKKLRADRLNEFSELAAKARRWADDNFDKLEAADPIMPDALNDRAADCWRILFAIAIEAGGSWRDRAQNAALAFSTENGDVETAATRLLSDLRELFDDQSVLFSEEIVKKLVAMEHRSWAEWGKNGEPMSKVQLARLVGHFGIRPKTVYRDGDKAKGYEREQFVDAFERYLSPRQRP